MEITKTFDENLKQRFANTFKFSNHDINNSDINVVARWCLTIRINGWLGKTSLPEKEDFYCNLNMEDITDAD